jgi:3-isopropylmalate/(R)-2-methylmalate dehydratase small subunit
MALAKITHVRGRAVPVPGDDIDTDRIIPARFLKCVTFDGLGAHAFHDVRFDEQGGPKGHPIDDPKHRGASILVSGNNFGCGSSREHAPQSLWYHGIRAIVAGSFAEIFFGNSTTLGIPCVSLRPHDLEELTRHVAAHPDEEIEIDVAAATVRTGAAIYQGSLPEGVRQSLVQGSWDPLAELLTGRERADVVAARLPAIGA